MAIFAFYYISHTVIISHVVFIMVKVLNFFFFNLRFFLSRCSSLSFNFFLLLCSLCCFGSFSFLFLFRIESSFSSVGIYNLSFRFLLVSSSGWGCFHLLFLLIRRFWTFWFLTGWCTLISRLLRSFFLMVRVNHILVFQISLKNIFLYLTLFQTWLF